MGKRQQIVLKPGDTIYVDVGGDVHEGTVTISEVGVPDTNEWTWAWVVEV